MKKLKCLFVFVWIIVIASCSQNNNTEQAGKNKDIENTQALQEPAAKSYSAIFTINHKIYQCSDVSAAADGKNNEMVIQVRSNADNDSETLYLAFTLNGIGTGTKNLDTAGNYAEFTDVKQYTYESKYTDDCTNGKSSTRGTITVKSLKEGTAETEGVFEADFEGKLMRKREVPPYPCAKGTSANKKIEFIDVKGSLRGSYVNTKNVPL